MSLRTRVSYLAQQEAEKIVRAFASQIAKQTTQSQTGSATFKKYNTDGSIQVSFSGGTTQNVYNVGSSYLSPGNTVIMLTDNTIIG